MIKILRRARWRRAHRWAPDHMSGYLDGELSRSRRGRIERHLGECQDCRRLLAGLRAIVGGLQALPAPSSRVGAVQIAASARARVKEPPPAE